MITKEQFERVADQIEPILFANRIGWFDPIIKNRRHKLSIKWLLVLGDREQWPKASKALNDLADANNVSINLSADGYLSVVANI